MKIKTIIKLPYLIYKIRQQRKLERLMQSFDNLVKEPEEYHLGEGRLAHMIYMELRELGLR